jgi:carbonic anhydrase
MKPSDELNPACQTVVHLPLDSESALSFKLDAAHFKTPSEHTVMLMHSPLEIQFEHKVDPNKS